jgi:photosystem II protein PsbQ
MERFRSILAVLLAFVCAFLVSCSSPTEVKPPTYTEAQIQQIQGYVSGLGKMRDRFPELAKLVQDENWTFVKNFIHGPLGELRAKMSLVERNLLPAEQPAAKAKSKDVFDDLNAIDSAASEQDYKAAIAAYAALQKDIQAFLELAPQS